MSTEDLTLFAQLAPDLAERIDLAETSDCWLWTGTRNYADYGVLGSGQPAHRATYEAAVGPIPAGLVIDHLCRVHACVNPSHLEPVTQRENVHRGIASRKAEAVSA